MLLQDSVEYLQSNFLQRVHSTNLILFSLIIRRVISSTGPNQPRLFCCLLSFIMLRRLKTIRTAGFQKASRLLHPHSFLSNYAFLSHFSALSWGALSLPTISSFPLSGYSVAALTATSSSQIVSSSFSPHFPTSFAHSTSPPRRPACPYKSTSHRCLG